MFQMRFIIVFISVISDIYGQFPIPGDDGSPTPVLDTNPVTIQTIAGETVILPCSVTNLGSFTISWLTSSYEMLARNDLIVIDDDTRLSVRVIDDTNWDLQIENVDSTDSGNYMCMIQMMPPQIKYVSLTVNAPPNILPSSFQERMEVAEGKPLTVTCITQGTPSPTVNWYYFKVVPETGTVRELYQGGNILTFNKVRRTDSAIYVCEAENEHGRAYREMRLIVNYAPRVTMPVRQVRVYEGSDAILECVAEGSPPPRIMWLWQNYHLTTSSKHKVEMYTDSDSLITAVLKVTETNREDHGKYRCLARNTVGQAYGSLNLAVIPVTSTSTTSTTEQSTTESTTELTTTQSATRKITSTESRRLPPLKPDDLLEKTTKESKTVYEVMGPVTPRTGASSKASLYRTDINLFTSLLLLILLYLQQML